MRILHIGDYHFKPKSNNYEQDLMVTKMIESLKSKSPIDLILFTGDLVNSGSRFSDFETAHEHLILKLSTELRVPVSNIIVCPGNHDIRREEAVKSIINYFDEKVTNSDLLYEEYVKKTHDYELSLKPSENFFKYIRKYFGDSYEEFDPLCIVNRRLFDGKQIAIVSLNSAWLSSGHREDINLLMFPSTVLKNAILKIKDADSKILMIHHPLSYFKEFNGVELENLIHKEFDLIFSGHIHREQISTRYAGYNGIYCNTTQATLTFDRDGEIGYSIVNLDLEQCGELIIERAYYVRKENRFVDLESVHVQVPVGAEKAQQNKLRAKIISKFPIELSVANELLLDYEEDSSGNFLDLFTQPVLSTNSGADNIDSDNHGVFNFETLLTDTRNFLIFGKDKSGKTTLLKKLQLYFLKNFSLLGKVPFFVDYKELEAKHSKIEFVKIIKDYYGISNSEAEKLIRNGTIVLLIDNLNTSSPVNDIMISFLEAQKSIQFIICSEYIASRVYFEELDHLDYSKLYFKDLTRKEIRLYSEKNNSVKKLDKEEVLERITKMLQQLQLPVNYWTISLILLIYKKSNDDYNKNLFTILDLCVDEILQKKKLTLTKASLGFDQYKSICSQVAFELLTNYKDDIYSASAITIIKFIDDLIKKNDRIVGDAKDIFDYLLEVGLLKEKNLMYTFRLNGLFEYFLAYYIHQHPEIKEDILENDNIYLSFKNELEIYSGLNRKDEDFLGKIFEKTRKVFDKINESYREYGRSDNVLMQKLGQVQDFAEKVKKLQIVSSLSHEIQDLAKDAVDPLGTASEVHLKEFIDSNKLTPEVLEKYLEIISRVFKNSDGITNLVLVYDIFDYLLESYINYGFYLIDEYAKISRPEGDMSMEELEDGSLSIGKDLLRMLSNFIPILSQVLLYDGIGHPNMTKIIEKHIEKYKADAKNNQYKLFLLYFLQMDIDIKTSKKLVKDVFDNITLGPLKVSTFFKLNFYLAFKAYGNRDLERHFQNKVRDAQSRIDKKSNDSKSIDVSISRKEKGNIVLRHKNR